MYCTNCGKKISDGANFCPHCGAGMPQPARDTGLPAGMTRTADGKLRWSFAEKKKTVACFLDGEALTVMYEVDRPKKRSALCSLLLDVGEWVAMEGDNYPAVPLPSELAEGGPAPTVMLDGREYNNFPLRFRYMSAVKEDRKKGTMKIFCGSSRQTVCLTPEQYDFVLNYILARAPRIKRK